MAFLVADAQNCHGWKRSENFVPVSPFLAVLQNDQIVRIEWWMLIGLDLYMMK
jgi:hypothetical protein